MGTIDCVDIVRAKKTLTKKPKEKREKKRKMVRAKKKRKEMTKFLFLLSPNLVISYYIYQIRHLIIISALLTKKRGKKRSTASVRNIPQSNGSKNAQKIPIQRAKCQTNPPSKKKRPNISLQNEKNIAKRWCFLSKKQKRILSSPFKNKTKQKFPLSNRTKKQNFALFCSCEFVLEINT